MIIGGFPVLIREYKWTEWKTIFDKKKLNAQFDDDGIKYTIWGYNGPEMIVCKIWIGALTDLQINQGYTEEQNSADKEDFETNYKDNFNNSLYHEVVTQFEKRDKTLKIAHGEGSVDEEGNVTILLKIPGTPGSSDGRWISSGTAFFDVHTAGDKVLGVYFTDEDNVLGGGSGTIIGSYTDDDADEINRGWAIPPIGFLKAESIGGYGFAPAGFYIKIVAKKSGDSPSGKFYVNFEWAATG